MIYDTYLRVAIMAGKTAVCATKFSSTEALPPSEFKYVFDVTNFKEESKLMLELGRAVKSQPYTWSVAADVKERNYEGCITVLGGWSGSARNSRSLIVNSSLTLLNCNANSSVSSLAIQYQVKAELLNEKTSVAVASKSDLRNLEKSVSLEVYAENSWLGEKLRTFGALPVTLRVTVEWKYLPAQQIRGWIDAATTASTPKPKPRYLELLHSKEKFFDVTIVCGAKEFRAHKLILAAASPVIARMLEDWMEEPGNGKLIIDDIDPDCLQLLLDYIYTGECPQRTSDLTLLQLLHCSDKYELEELKAMLLNKMVETLSEENAAVFLATALEFAPGSAAVTAMIAFCKPRFFKLCQIPEWKEILVANLDLFIASERQ